MNLTINDSKDAIAQNPTIDDGSLKGMTSAEIDYASSNLASLVIKFGTGNNSILVSDTPSNAQNVQTVITTGNGNNTIGIDGATGPLKITAGAGNDIFNVGSAAAGLQNILSNLTLDGGAGNDTVNFADANGCSATYTLGPASLIDNVTYAYTNFETLSLTGLVGGSNVYDVQGTGACNHHHHLVGMGMSLTLPPPRCRSRSTMLPAIAM